MSGSRRSDFEAKTMEHIRFEERKATGNLRAVHILLGHAKIENMVRYLGVDVEDALTLAEGIEV